MKTVIVNGTYRKKGMTSFLIDRISDGIKTNRKSIIKNIFLMETDFEYCRGCSICMHEKSNSRLANCTINDGFGDILEEMLDANIIVLATPVFEMGPSAIMKKFMERCVPLMDYKGFLKARNKKDMKRTCVIMLSTGAPYPLNYILGITRYPESILRKVSALFGCGKVHLIRAGAMEASEKNKCLWGDKAYALGKNLSSSK